MNVTTDYCNMDVSIIFWQAPSHRTSLTYILEQNSISQSKININSHGSIQMTLKSSLSSMAQQVTLLYKHIMCNKLTLKVFFIYMHLYFYPALSKQI